MKTLLDQWNKESMELICMEPRTQEALNALCETKARTIVYLNSEIERVSNILSLNRSQLYIHMTEHNIGLQSKIYKRNLISEKDLIRNQIHAIVELFNDLKKEMKPALSKERQFVESVRRLAEEGGFDFFVVTDGASATSNSGSDAVRNARLAHVQWELENGHDPDEDWSNKKEVKNV